MNYSVNGKKSMSSNTVYVGKASVQNGEHYPTEEVTVYFTEDEAKKLASRMQSQGFNDRLLREIAHLRYLRSIDVHSDRITHCLEILRVVRNAELDLTYEEGLLEEDAYIENVYDENAYATIEEKK